MITLDLKYIDEGLKLSIHLKNQLLLNLLKYLPSYVNKNCQLNSYLISHSIKNHLRVEMFSFFPNRKTFLFVILFSYARLFYIPFNNISLNYLGCHTYVRHIEIMQVLHFNHTERRNQLQHQTAATFPLSPCCFACNRTRPPKRTAIHHRGDRRESD